MDKYRQVAEAFAQAAGFADDERVRAVFIVGSSASGLNDAYSDVDMMVAVTEPILDKERLQLLHDLGCHNIMLAIAGVNNPALPVQSQVIDKFVFQDVWFDVSYHLPHQLQFCFDYATLIDKEGLEDHLCGASKEYDDEMLKARAQADLRLLHARVYRYEKYALRQEWIGIDLTAIKNLVVDLLMVLNNRPNYNRFSSRISRLLHELPLRPESCEAKLLDILHLDDREMWRDKLEMMRWLESSLLEMCEARWGPIPMYDD